MAKKNDLTPFATEGFKATSEKKCPYLESSAAAMAWYVGAWLQKTGRTAPRDVAMSRGYTIRANDMLLDASKCPEITRIS